jgi:hypothetical protein
MKNLALLVVVLGLLGLAGCESGLSSLDLYHDEPLPALPAADRITIRSPSGRTVPVTEITDHDKVVQMVEFVNALPNKWNVPWENPPAGKVYFTFQKGRVVLGNFYVGTLPSAKEGKPGSNFFGRNTNNNFSQVATEAQIRALGEIAGFDIWEMVKPAPAPAKESTPAK